MTVATLGYTIVICGTHENPQHRYRGRIEKVKFGVPIEEAFAHDIPATLLVLLLKVHKDGPAKKDIWRAPGNQAQVRKLSHIMQHGRLVNIANFSVYTAASVIKKFLSKVPGGIFGIANEQHLFDLYNEPDLNIQRQSFCRVIRSLPVPSQHLLVLLFGTFYMISNSANSFGSRMTPEAIGISVAPSLFHSCIHDGQRAKMEDVMRFKIASEVTSRIIQSFGYADLFPRDCYEFYARITGRTLHVDENDSRLRFAIPANAPGWPVAPPSAYTMMAAQCAGSYSMGTVATIDDQVGTECGRHKDCNPKHDHTLILRGGSLQNEHHLAGPLMHSQNITHTGVGKERGCDYSAASYGRTFFGTGPHHITVATIDDEPLTPMMNNNLRPHNAPHCVELRQSQQRTNYEAQGQMLTISDFEMHESASCDF